MPFKSMDDIIAGHKGKPVYDDLLTKSIPHIQSTLRKQDEKKKITVKQMKALVKLEKEGKNRKSMLRWLRECIGREEIVGEYYLDYMATVGIYKSAMQKYIRRGHAEKAVRAAKALRDMQPSSLTRRLKVIIPEDVYTCMNLYQYVDEHPLEVAYTLAMSKKDGHCCRAFNEIKDTKAFERITDLVYFKDHWKDGDLSRVISTMFAVVRKEDGLAAIGRVFDEPIGKQKAARAVMDELLNNSKVDIDLTLVALLRMLRDGYEDTVLMEDDFIEAVEPMYIDEVDWFAYDMHTFPGRIVMNLLAKDHHIKSGAVSWSWWFGEASRRIPEADPPDEYKKFIGVREKSFQIKWKKMREDAIEKVFYVCRELFKLKVPEKE